MANRHNYTCPWEYIANTIKVNIIAQNTKADVVGGCAGSSSHPEERLVQSYIIMCKYIYQIPKLNNFKIYYTHLASYHVIHSKHPGVIGRCPANSGHPGGKIMG